MFHQHDWVTVNLLAGSTIVSNYAYLVNPNGQRTDLTQTGSAFTAARSIAWGYDTLGQVTTADSINRHGTE